MQKDKWQTGEIFATHIIVKELLSLIYWKHQNWEEKTTTIIKNWAKDMHRKFTEKEMQMVLKFMKRYSTQLIYVKEMQI